MMLVFTAVFARLVHVPSEGVPYALFAYAGLLPWTCFSSAVSNSTNSLVGHAQLVTKVFFPREILPLSYVIAAGVDLAIGAAVLVGLAIYYSVPLTAELWFVVPIVAVLGGYALACGLVLSAVQVRFRDVGVALPIALQLLMFASPVLYPLRVVPAQWRTLYLLNPLAGLIDGFRRSVLGMPVDGQALLVGAAVTMVALPLAYVAFKYRGHHRGRRYLKEPPDVTELEVTNVSKRYWLPKPIGSAVEPGGWARRAWSRVWPSYDAFWALRNVDFTVARGEAVGVIGPNGAGKSTLLKLLSEITAPTTGEIRLHGRLSALIEVGSGFHPELTGRENVFLSGSILGMRRAEIVAKLDQIIAFAGIGDFIDAPVKWYSSGMCRSARFRHRGAPRSADSAGRRGACRRRRGVSAQVLRAHRGPAQRR